MDAQALSSKKLRTKAAPHKLFTKDPRPCYILTSPAYNGVESFRIFSKGGDRVFEPSVVIVPSQEEKDGTRRWVERLYLSQSDSVFTFLRYRVRDAATAEDLTARTFQRVVERADSYRADRGSETAWLFAIARHVLVDYLRTSRRRETAPLKEELRDGRPTPEDALLRQERFDALAGALASLPDRMQLALSLKYGGGLSHANIGKVLHTSEKQVGVLVHRARQKLKPMLERRLSDETD